MAPEAIFLLPLLFVHGLAQGLFQFGGEGLANSSGSNNIYNTGSLSSFSSNFNSPAVSNGKKADEVPKELVKPALMATNADKNLQVDPRALADLATSFLGAWGLVAKDSGVSGMHIILTPNNKLIIYDAAAFRISNLKLPDAKCVAFIDKKSNKQQRDCWAHGIELDPKTAKIRPLKVEYDPWCSSGGLTADGKVVGTGGWDNGVKTVRYISPCDGCEFVEFQTALSDPRWYATQITLADGRFLVVGGRRAYSYEYVPPPGATNGKNGKFMLPLLDKTTDLDENNLYPFVYLSTDGNVFIFANNRSILLNPATNAVLRELPVLDGGARNYPASAMSALLPLRLDLYVSAADPKAAKPPVPAEVIVCGGARHEAYAAAGKGVFIPALDDCNRMVITDPKPVWRREQMPSRRVMGDMLVLPTGDLLLINGAQAGTSAWFFAEKPNLTPLLYRPDEKVGSRFTLLKSTNVPRMYHSSAALLPDGKIIIAGSNTNPGYNYTAKYPTELRVEIFTPPYLDPALAKKRPVITPVPVIGAPLLLTYGKQFDVAFKLAGSRLADEEVKVTMYAPPFTTHGYSMNQRLIVLFKGKGTVARTSKAAHKVTVFAPPSAVFAPPGFYLLFVVYRGVPSEGIWVRMLK